MGSSLQQGELIWRAVWKKRDSPTHLVQGPQSIAAGIIRHSTAQSIHFPEPTPALNISFLLVVIADRSKQFCILTTATMHTDQQNDMTAFTSDIPRESVQLISSGCSHLASEWRDTSLTQTQRRQHAIAMSAGPLPVSLTGNKTTLYWQKLFGETDPRLNMSFSN